MDLADTLFLALEDDNRKLRAQFPNLFAKVDEIRVQRDHSQPPLAMCEASDCGATFVPGPHQRFCSRRCKNRVYWHKRKAA